MTLTTLDRFNADNDAYVMTKLKATNSTCIQTTPLNKDHPIMIFEKGGFFLKIIFGGNVVLLNWANSVSPCIM